MATIHLSNLNVTEHPQVGTVIGTLSVQDGKNNETFAYTLTGDAAGRFEIKLNATTGLYELLVKDATSALYDYDTGQTAFNITITATSNSQGNPTSVDPAALTLNVINNTAPTALALQSGKVMEHEKNGTVISDFIVTDPDANETFSYTLTDDAGGRFDIVDGKLVVKDGSLLDYLTAQSHQITVEVKDSDNNTYSTALTVNVGDAFDIVNGTAKNNRLFGTAGADMINGFGGNDKLYGLAGDDVLNGGTGKDMLYGGLGKDIFVFDTKVKKGHFDHIKDFNVADDTIQVKISALSSFKVKMSKKGAFGPKKGSDKHSAFKLDKILEKGLLDKKFFSKADKAKDSNDLFYYNSKNGFLYIDADGSGTGKGIEIAKLSRGLNLTADDLIFI